MEEQFNNLNGLESINKLIESFDRLNHNLEKLTKGYKTIKNIIPSSSVIKTLSTFTNKIVPNLQQEKTAAKLSSFTIGQEKASNNINQITQDTITGGSRSNNITINVGKFFENMVLEGTIKENEEDILSQFQDCMYRTLASVNGTIK